VTINDELLFEDVQQGLSAFVGEVARAHDGVDDVVIADAAVSDMGLAVAVDAEDVLAADTDDGAVDFDAGFLFGDGDRLTDSGGGGGDVAVGEGVSGALLADVLEHFAEVFEVKE